MCIAETITILKDITVGGAAAVAAYAAYRGIESWRNELGGKASFEVSRDLLRVTYKLRDEIQYFRSPFIDGRDFPEGYSPIAETDAEKTGDAYAHVYNNRWKPVGNAARDFDGALLEAETLWGEELKEKGKTLLKAVHTLRISMEAFITDKYERGEDFKADPDFAQSVKHDLYSRPGRDDPLTTTIDSAISSMEKSIRPHLSKGEK